MLLYSLDQIILPKEKEENELRITPTTKGALWESSIEEQHLSSLVPLLLSGLVLAASLSTYEEMGLQTNERLDLSMALKQLQVVTWAKYQLKWELLHKQHKPDVREDKLIATHANKIQASTTKWKEKLADKQEDQ